MEWKFSPYSRTEHQSPGLANCSLLTIVTELSSFTFPNYCLKLWTKINYKFLRFLNCNYTNAACRCPQILIKFRVIGSLQKFLYLACYCFYIQVPKIRTTEHHATSWICANIYAQIYKKLLDKKRYKLMKWWFRCSYSPQSLRLKKFALSYSFPRNVRVPMPEIVKIIYKHPIY
jgi:hypothetical protein